jgi:uncharacterized protein
MGEILLDVILLMVLSRAFWKLVGGVVTGMKAKPQPPRPERGIQMVRDPVCGTFVVPDRAVVLADGRQQLYFCSTTCRDRYRARTA